MLETSGPAKSRVIHSHESDNWSTPDDFFQYLNAIFNFTLDPCSSDQNHKCETYFTESDDGLAQPWAPHRVFMNPPYSQVGAWMQKAVKESKKGAHVVALVGARIDTLWWRSFVRDAHAEIHFLKRRLRFGGAKNSAPFPSAIVIYYPASPWIGPEALSKEDRDE